jgi:nucleoside-diphosphate-sugar epimerase
MNVGRVLVTGGGGFLGTAVSRLLRRRGLAVRSLSRTPHPHLDELGVEQVRGDVADAPAVARAVEGCGTVFHIAAKAGLWGPEREYRRANVDGTWNILEACRAAGVPRLVYTSSPSVVFNGEHLPGADESAPYPSRFDAAYPETKAIAEQLVLAANSPALSTVSLRPHLIWGPGDNNLLPRIIARARSGRLRRIGRVNALIDPVYIDNAAEAHVLASDHLGPGSPAAGRAYFITQGETIPVWDMINALLRAAHMEPVRRSIPRLLAIAGAGTLEAAYRLSGRDDEPPMTRFLARQLSTTHWFRIDAARRDLGYEPRVSIADGLRRLEDWLHRENRLA